MMCSQPGGAPGHGLNLPARFTTSAGSAATTVQTKAPLAHRTTTERNAGTNRRIDGCMMCPPDNHERSASVRIFLSESGLEGAREIRHKYDAAAKFF